MAIKKLTHTLLCTLLLLCSGCSSTEILDTPDSGRQDIIALNLSAPQLKTRADDSHKLRYVAKLLKLTADGKDYVSCVTQHLIEEGESGATSRIIFEGVEEGKYEIVLFADYIPADSQADEKGLYPDEYYDTSAIEDVKMKKFGKDALNNDNYDCFATTFPVTKTEDEVEKSISLTRVVAKVMMVGNPSAGVTASEVSIRKLSTHQNYKITSGKASELYRYPNQDVPSAPWEVAPVNTAENELFYFYSFANSGSAGKTEGLGEFVFTVSADGLEPKATTIGSGEVEVTSNYIIRVKGNFLPAHPEDPATRTDRIILDVSTLSDGWQTQDQAPNK